MAGFAGSQRVDERRRRRLATETEKAESASDSGLECSGATVGLRIGHFHECDCPAAGLVFRQRWKHWCAAAGLWLIAIALSVGAFHSQWVHAHIGPEVGRLCTAQDSALVRWFSELVLLLAAESALLVWWGRSRSASDFSGRYRVWGWCAAACLGFGFCVATDLHQILARLAVQRFDLKIPDPALLWLAPVAACGLWIGWRVRGEMSGCAASRRVVLLAGLCYAGAAGLKLAGMGCVTLPAGIEPWLTRGLILSGHVALLLSLTLHAHHVLSNTPEPPPNAAPSGWLRAMLARWFARRAPEPVEETAAPKRRRKATGEASAPKKRKRSAPKRTRKAAEPVESEEVEEEEDPAAETDDCEIEETGARNDYEEPAEAEQTEEDSTSEEEEVEERQPVARGGRNFRVDAEEEEPPEPHFEGVSREQMKGLSKRERRRLQQQQRDAERASRR
ncbi:MAG TPA: hypothetical protein VHB77_01230 [Planctomycetaceae bacterium]|nr:hypothetical protein [Planctomycetaceae bacterium]